MKLVLRHSVSYLLMRGGPALLNLVGLLLFTRLLAPAEFGKYAIVVAAAAIGNAAMFWWVQLALLRFLPAHRGNREVLLSALAAGYVTTVLFTLPVLGIALLLHEQIGMSPLLIAIGGALMWSTAWHDLNLEMARSELSPKRYGLLLAARSIIFVTVGATLAAMHMGAIAVLLGAIAGAAIPSLVALRYCWRGVRLHLVKRGLIGELLRYGMPLVLTSALMLVVNSSDRFFLRYLNGESVVGIYAAGYDLAQFSLGALMNVVYLAFFPLAVRALEDSGAAAARSTLKTGYTALLAIGVPATAGLTILSSDFTHVFLGARYVSTAAVIPWVALGTFLGSLKAFYFDFSFQIAKATVIQFVIAAITALLNVVLNIIWIPRSGILGAAYATAVSFALGALLSAALGARVFKVPVPMRDSLQVLLATSFMAVALLATRDVHGGAVALFARVGAGMVTYAAAAIALNLLDCRSAIARWFAARSPFQPNPSENAS